MINLYIWLGGLASARVVLCGQLPEAGLVVVQLGKAALVRAFAARQELRDQFVHLPNGHIRGLQGLVRCLRRQRAHAGHIRLLHQNRSSL